MTTFLRAYVHAALWTSDPHPPSGDYADRAAELESRVDAAWLTEAERDCSRFCAENAALLEQAGSDDQNGHDFWLTRNGHGTGFRDRGYADEVGRGLSDAARRFGPHDMDWPLPDVTEQRELALALLDWHGGQSSALYAVGSCMLAACDRDEVYRPDGETVAAALAELGQCDLDLSDLAARLRGCVAAAQEGGR